MSTHTVHGDVHEHGLADGCDRCAEHAQQPFATLDNTMLSNLIERVIEEEKPRSVNENIAMMQVKMALRTAAEIAELHPILFSKYLLKTRGLQMVAVVKP